MNAYFSRTPEDFNYDGAQPGAGDLHDLRVATRDALRELDRTLTYVHDKFAERIEALEEAVQAHVEDIGDNAFNIDVLKARVDGLDVYKAEDHGKYAHLTEAQIGQLVAVLKVYEDPESWRVSKPSDKKSWFRNTPERPYTLARMTLEDLGL